MTILEDKTTICHLYGALIVLMRPVAFYNYTTFIIISSSPNLCQHGRYFDKRCLGIVAKQESNSNTKVDRFQVKSVLRHRGVRNVVYNEMQSSYYCFWTFLTSYHCVGTGLIFTRS